MPWETWFTFSLLGLVFLGLIRNYAADALLVGAVVVCGAVGILEPKEVFAGFSNTGMLTVAALYIVAAALRETGALSIVGGALLGQARTERGVFLRMSATVTTASAFLNNTPIVAMFIPVLLQWCKHHKTSPSRLLLPLSYLSILGGTCTLIGTSTNLVVNGLMVEKFNEDPQAYAALHSMTLFEMSAVGIPYAIAGTAYLLFWGLRRLPKHQESFERFADKAREYLVNMRIEKGCTLAGKTVEEAGLRHLPGLFLVEIVRDGERITPVSPEQGLHEGDVLTFTGVVESIVDLQRIRGFTPLGQGEVSAALAAQRGAMLCEAVLSPTAPILGKTIRDSDFRALYNAAVIAVHRGGERIKGRVGDIVLRGGDTLLLQAGPHFTRAHRDNPDFYLVSGIEDSAPVQHDKAMGALALLGLLVLLMATGFIPIVLAAFLVAGLMVVTRCVTVSAARKSLDLQTLVTICAAFGFGQALVNAGCVEAVTNAIITPLKGFPPVFLLAGVYLATSIFTEVVTNNAAAALMFPFALGPAMKMGLDPRPFCMAVAFAASASFVTPLGYQTNLMVYGPGGYRFGDFVRVGLPLNIILLTTATLLIPLRWPL